MPIVGQKYQVVVPKAARKVSKKIKPGVEVEIVPIDESTVLLKAVGSPEEWIKATRGILKDHYRRGKDATQVLRKMREEEWR